MLQATAAFGQGAGKTRLAIVGLDHDHVWGMLHDIAAEPQAELVAVADPRPELVAKAKAQVPATVKFYDDYVKMLDEAKPEAVIVTTENDKHLAILRECAKPKLFISGAHDEFAPLPELQKVIASVPGPRQFVVIEGVGHFFEGKLDQVRGVIEQWVRETLLAGREVREN